MWDEAYAAIMRYSRATDGFWVCGFLQFGSSASLNMMIVPNGKHEQRGCSFLYNRLVVGFLAWTSSTSRGCAKCYQVAFNLSVFLTSPDCFAHALLPDYNLWREHSGLPEVYDTNYKRATSHQYPLRPGKFRCLHSKSATADRFRRVHRVYVVLVPCELQCRIRGKTTYFVKGHTGPFLP